MTFDDIYRTNAWNGIETRSGPGSHREPTRRVAETIVDLVEWLGVRSVLDVGCGEGNWMPDLGLVSYCGVDVSEEAIVEAKRRHPDRMYLAWDLVAHRLPGYVDLVISRDVVQHLSLVDGVALVAAMRAHTTTWLLASTYVDGDNVDIVTGDAYRPNLEAPPFDLGPAVSLIRDGYVYHNGDAIRDNGKMLGLWRST